MTLHDYPAEKVIALLEQNNQLQEKILMEIMYISTDLRTIRLDGLNVTKGTLEGGD